MLTSQDARGDSSGPQGCSPPTFTNLRQQLESPSQLDEEYRQRLLDLTERLVRVQALGGEYHRVSLSPYAATAINQDAAVA
ncbi:MAG: hypothetical protein ACYSTL_06285 [Planctomycetota bacterium]|jgi:hypothetical protein